MRILLFQILAFNPLYQTPFTPCPPTKSKPRPSRESGAQSHEWRAVNALHIVVVDLWLYFSAFHGIIEPIAIIVKLAKRESHHHKCKMHTNHKNHHTIASANSCVQCYRNNEQQHGVSFSEKISTK